MPSVIPRSRVSPKELEHSVAPRPSTEDNLHLGAVISSLHFYRLLPNICNRKKIADSKHVTFKALHTSRDTDYQETEAPYNSNAIISDLSTLTKCFSPLLPDICSNQLEPTIELWTSKYFAFQFNNMQMHFLKGFLCRPSQF